MSKAKKNQPIKLKKYMYEFAQEMGISSKTKEEFKEKGNRKGNS